MAAVVQNLYVPPGTGRPGVLTNVQQPEVPPDLDRRASGFLPYSSLYPSVDPQQGAKSCVRGRLYKWSMVGALVVLVGVVGIMGFLLVSQSKRSSPRFYPSFSTSSSSPTTPKVSSSTRETPGYKTSGEATTRVTGTNSNSGINLLEITKKEIYQIQWKDC